MNSQVTINQSEDCKSNVSVNHDNDRSVTHDWSESIFPIPHLYREEFRKQNITPQHIKQTKRLFKDFHISLPTDFKQIVKQFNYYYELENWRRYYIVSQLNQMEKEAY